jgi:hypothetical protein
MIEIMKTRDQEDRKQKAEEGLQILAACFSYGQVQRSFFHAFGQNRG